MGGFSRTVSHQYDRDGGEVETTFPDGAKFWTARDGLGRPTEGWQGALGSTAHIMIAFGYNAAGQRSHFARRFADNSSYAYDGAGRLSAVDDHFAGGVGNTRSELAYNPASQLSSESRTNDSYAWTGSAAVSRPYAANGLNQYTSAGPATFTYDANGNLTSDGTTNFTYDAENRLTSASGAKNASLTYDPLYWYEGAGLDQPRFPHVNHQGSVTATAGPGATPLWINTYDEYGIPGRFYEAFRAVYADQLEALKKFLDRSKH